MYSEFLTSYCTREREFCDDGAINPSHTFLDENTSIDDCIHEDDFLFVFDTISCEGKTILAEDFDLLVELIEFKTVN